MSVTQISRIQVRRGRRDNLPQLSAGELGWAQDTRQLFIGNGTFIQGAPAEGNTEILTEFSDAVTILNQQQVKEETLLNNISSATSFYTTGLTAMPAGVLRYRISKDVPDTYNAQQVGYIMFAYNGDGTSGDGTIKILDTRIGDANIGVTFTAGISSESVNFYYTNSENVNVAIRFTVTEF